MEFKNKDILVRICINSYELSKMNKPEQYEDFLEKRITKKFIDGMIGLLEEKG